MKKGGHELGLPNLSLEIPGYVGVEPNEREFGRGSSTGYNGL